MRIVFMGTPDFAVPSLEAIVRAGHEVVTVVCQPDAVSGRRQAEATPPPVKRKAQEAGIPVYQPKGLRLPKNQAPLHQLAPELIVVVAYGKILPKEVLDLPPRGCINVHGSLLPALRGAAPVQWAIASGLQVTGVTTMLMDEGMDTGPILQQRELAIGAEETGQELAERMARVGAELLTETLSSWEAGQLQPRDQPEQGVSMAPILRKEDGYVDWSAPAVEIAWRARGFWPWPGSVCLGPDGKTLKLHRLHATEGSDSPGSVLEVSEAGIVVGTGSGALLLEEVQPESRKRMHARDYARGQRVTVGQRFGQLQAG